MVLNKETKKQELIGVGAVLASATCFALTSILIKVAFSRGLNPTQTMALQSWIASFLLLLYGLVFDRQLFKISRKTMLVLAFQGIFGSLGTSLLYSYALLYLPVSVAILLLYLYPVLVLGAGVAFLHKKIGLKESLALLFTLAGTTLASGIFTGVTEVAIGGIVLGLAAAFAYAIFNVVGEVALQEVSPLTAMSYSQWFSSLGLFVYLRGDMTQIPWTNLGIVGIGAALATIASILPFYLILLGIQKIGSDRASILSTFELPVTFLFAAFFLEEIPSVLQLVGGGFVLGGILLLNWKGKKEREQTN